MRLLGLRAAIVASLGVLVLVPPYVGAEDDDDDDDDATPAPPANEKEESEPTVEAYVRPDVDGLHWVETFDGEVFSRWKKSKKEKYNGDFEVAKRKTEALTGDLGLLVPVEARHYGISSDFAPITGEEGKDFIVQMEVRFQDDLSCGGSYMKLFNRDEAGAEDFDNDTPYVIMFGPDRCGATDKVHFILRHQSPKTGEWEEKHFKDAPSVPRDKMTHLYGLVVKSDNSFEIQIDGVKKAGGSLLDSMNPPVNPPAEIDDPADSKPKDWVDDEKMDDPASSKPDDWDEDAPAKIKDPAATMPSGWIEDAEKRIADPNAKMPDDWDEEEDGEWEAPIIDNPACSVGCGKWVPPEISNPEYKGKWYAPKVDNPAYIGVWKPRQIANPNYFKDEHPARLPKISAVGFDLWTMSGGILFDNIVVAKDVAKVEAFTDQTWRKRKAIEDLQQPKPSKSDGIFAWLGDNLMVAIAGAVALVVLLIVFCCYCMGQDDPYPPAAVPAPKRKAKKEKEEEEEEDDDDNGEKDDAKEEKKEVSGKKGDGMRQRKKEADEGEEKDE